MEATVKLCECGCGRPAPIAQQNRPNAKRGQPLRFLKGHHQRKAAGDESWKEDFWKRVDKTSDPNGCWIWTGPRTPGGYGFFHINRATHKKTYVASRLAYRLVVGEIKDGWTVDHVKERCTNLLCVNPLHLEAVPHSVNLLRGNTVNARNAAKTHCDHGHPFDAENTYIRPDNGTRMCRACGRAASQRYYNQPR